MPRRRTRRRKSERRVVVRGTRVPVTAFFENIEDGATVENFLEWFPGVKREQVQAVLEFTERSLAIA